MVLLGGRRTARERTARVGRTSSVGPCGPPCGAEGEGTASQDGGIEPQLDTAEMAVLVYPVAEGYRVCYPDGPFADPVGRMHFPDPLVTLQRRLEQSVVPLHQLLATS